MPRYPRTFLSGYAHHIVQRGHDRQPVFAAVNDYRYYLANLKEQKEALNIRVFAYCLMTNHIHLIVKPDGHPVSVSRLMRMLAARQTRYTNKVEYRRGTLWEGRFKCSLIDTEPYLLACTRYVDLNPVRAAMTPRPEAYRWSSYRARAGFCASDWLDFDPLYVGLSESVDERQEHYRAFVMAAIPDAELTLIRAAIQRNQLTGTHRFIDAIEAKIGRRIEARAPGRPQRNAAMAKK